MKFVTFVWVNSLAVAFALLVLSLDQQELNLLCTNTDTQISSILDGRMITSEGSVDTFGTAINVAGTSAVELKYPAAEPKNVSKFEVIASGEGLVLSQSDISSKLSTLKLFSDADQWWGELIEREYGAEKATDVVMKVYYCG